MNEVIADVEVAFDGIYLPYPRHTQMQHAIDRVRLHGVRANGQPMRGLRILGPTGSGKTTGINHYARHLKATGTYSSEAVPLLYIRLRKKTTVNQILRTILMRFGDRYALKRSAAELTDQVSNSIQRSGVELIVLDECQHLKNLSNDSLEVTDQFKVFLDDSIAPVVFVGTYEAQSMFTANRELCGRLGEPVDLRPLRDNDPEDAILFRDYLHHLDTALIEGGLTVALSNLANEDSFYGLFQASGGVIGTAHRIVRAALLHATGCEAQKIERVDLSFGVERWAIPNGFSTVNPFRSSRKS